MVAVVGLDEKDWKVLAELRRDAKATTIALQDIVNYVKSRVCEA